MAVSPVQNNSNKNVSYAKSAAIGALVGYSSKYLLPISSQEKDDSFVSEMTKIKVNAKSNTLKIIEGERGLKAYTKSIRPTGTFVFVGLITGLLIACARNLKRGLAQESATKSTN